jgi:hypothetical protein
MVHDRCLPVNATLETEPKLCQLICLSLPIHTSANAAQAGGRVDLDGYRSIYKGGGGHLTEASCLGGHQIHCYLILKITASKKDDGSSV